MSKYIKPQQYFLGGLVKGVGKVFKGAAPALLGGLGNMVIPGLGGVIGGALGEGIAGLGGQQAQNPAGAVSGMAPGVQQSAVLAQNAAKYGNPYAGGGYRKGGVVLAEGGVAETMDPTNPLYRRMAQRYRAAGYSDQMIAAMIGNSMVESDGLRDKQTGQPRADIQERLRPGRAGRGGLGPYQHTGPRRRQLEQFIEDRGLPAGRIDTYVDYNLQEMDGDYRNVRERMRQAPNAGEAAWAFASGFEAPEGTPDAIRTGDRSRLSHFDRRLAETNKAMSQIGQYFRPGEEYRAPRPIRLTRMPSTPMPGGRASSTATSRTPGRRMKTGGFLKTGGVPRPRGGGWGRSDEALREISTAAVQRFPQDFDTESGQVTAGQFDTLQEIAERNGISYRDLLRLNPGIDPNVRTGQQITVASQGQVARPAAAVPEAQATAPRRAQTQAVRRAAAPTARSRSRSSATSSPSPARAVLDARPAAVPATAASRSRAAATTAAPAAQGTAPAAGRPATRPTTASRRAPTAAEVMANPGGANGRVAAARPRPRVRTTDPRVGYWDLRESGERALRAREVGRAQRQRVIRGLRRIPQEIARGAYQIATNPPRLPSLFKTGGLIPAIGQIPGARPMKGGAVSFHGPKHEKGGIAIAPNVEVEGGETMDGALGGQPYVFSAAVNVPGTQRSFADKHKDMVARDANQVEIDRLAVQQEKAAGRGPSQSYARGGVVDPLMQLPSMPRYQEMPMTVGQGPGRAGRMMQGIGRGIGAAGRWTNSDAGQSAFEYLPGLLSLGVAGLAPSQQVRAPRIDPTLVGRGALNELRGMQTTVDVGAQLRANSATGRRMLAQPGVSNAALLAGQGQEMAANGEVLGAQRNQEMELRNSQAQQIAQMTGQFDMADASARGDANTRNANAQFEADRFNTASGNDRTSRLLDGVRELATVRAAQRERGDLRGAEAGAQKMEMTQLMLHLGTLEASKRAATIGLWETSGLITPEQAQRMRSGLPAAPQYRPKNSLAPLAPAAPAPRPAMPGALTPPTNLSQVGNFGYPSALDRYMPR